MAKHLMRTMLIVAATAAVVMGGVFYAAVSTLCDGNHWPDW